MKDFNKKIKETYKEDQVKEILSYLDLISGIKTNSLIFNKDFALKFAENIIENKLDHISVIVGLVYPFYVDCKISEDEIKNKEVLSIIQTLSFLDKINISNKDTAENGLKKMFMAIAKDLRAIIIKLCYEEQNLNCFMVYDLANQDRLIKMASEMYAPLAAMLGLSQIKNSIENAVYKYQKPDEYVNLKKAIENFVSLGTENINQAIERLKAEITPLIPNVKIYGRQKQLYSIAKKLQSKNMDVNSIIEIYGNKKISHVLEQNYFKDIKLKEIVDILALRVLVNTEDECYLVLGKIYSLFTPAGNFKNYILHPKENGYQSIHTLVLTDNGDPLEIQIRTFEMHEYAEYGFAAHWAYKAKNKVAESDKKINYIRKVMDYYKEKSPEELAGLLKSDVYSGIIFVQSPMGKILEFPEGSSPVDFAYAIHSKIGESCVGAKVNGKIVPLNTKLNNGDVVEIITGANARGPSRDWLSFVKTAGARNKINVFFKKEMKEENIKKGLAAMEAQAKLKGINLGDLLKPEYLKPIFERYSLSSLDELYSVIGYGDLTSSHIVNRLIAQDAKIANASKIILAADTTPTSDKNQGAISIDGVNDMFVKFAKCCNPLPGDDIIGYVSRGRGITVHRKECSSLGSYESERLINCTWTNEINENYVGSIKIVVQTKANILADISQKIANMKVLLLKIAATNLSDGNTIIRLKIAVKKRQELDYVITKLNQIKYVLRIDRDN